MIKDLMKKCNDDSKLEDVADNDQIWKNLKLCTSIWSEHTSDQKKLKSQYDLFEVKKVFDEGGEGEDESEYHYILNISGGNNGSSDWSSYFLNLNHVVTQLKKFYHVWLIELDNDCPDDIHYAYIGVREKDTEN